MAVLHLYALVGQALGFSVCLINKNPVALYRTFKLFTSEMAYVSSLTIYYLFIWVNPRDLIFVSVL